MSATLIASMAPAILAIIDKIVPDSAMGDKIKSEIASQMLTNNSEIASAAANVIMAEAQGESWLQRNWRPMMMLWFAFLIGAFWFGFVPVNMPLEVVQDLFLLVQIGIGGYVVGRSGEKIAKVVAPHLGSK